MDGVVVIIGDNRWREVGPTHFKNSKPLTVRNQLAGAQSFPRNLPDQAAVLIKDGDAAGWRSAAGSEHGTKFGDLCAVISDVIGRLSRQGFSARK